MLAFILPPEMAPFPDIRPAVTAGELECTPLEAILFPLGIGLRRRLLTQQPARVNEMLLRR
jgi:hypothetical protein